VSFYVALGDGRFESTPRTRGPWDPRNQHAGPPSALLAGEMEKVSENPEMAWARLTFEILGGIPVGEVAATVSVERPGRSVELLAGELRAGDRAVLRARGWRVLGAPVATEDGSVPPPLPAEAAPPPPSFGEFGYASSVEWRWSSGGWMTPGPATVWTRLLAPILDGEEPSPLQRVLAVADSGNGVSALLPWDEYYFINTELTVHLLRPPRGEWVCMAAQTEIAREGAGLASSVLSDADGPVARGAQALLIAPRPR
jgi:Thioesterase-like superfamily